MTAAVHMLTRGYWVNARAARHPSPDIARQGQAMLWGFAQSETVPERIRNAALRHLSVVGEKGERINCVKPVEVVTSNGRDWV